MDVSDNAKSFQTVCLACRNGGKTEPLKAVEPPKWVKILKRLRKPADKGVGDTAQRIAAKFGGERYKALSKRLGMPCGCTSRQSEWNKLYPYGD